MKIFKRMWWAVAYLDLSEWDKCSHNVLYDYVVEGDNYFPVRKLSILGWTPFAAGFGPYDRYEEARKICDFFNEEGL